MKQKTSNCLWCKKEVPADPRRMGEAICKNCQDERQKMLDNYDKKPNLMLDKDGKLFVMKDGVWKEDKKTRVGAWMEQANGGRKGVYIDTKEFKIFIEDHKGWE